ncbi:hypothetical protein MNEG_6169 [Monoraphidium neglectum]|uniref:Uncharacterized protein n=1 Tax=Monoraphidium neglectum TaxID=145388 RepID=A0A0D2L3L3_9CHLO|nr:hypothetical protein MNEG_6169 [Monoraphidium neglectum]KIZ01794.1 hypothetical protein MNEG_6169 [Monoraphidium neglectum]|eukprot:XP_013900813.1 hypothetical protein MNEG_6169 [Monoraphidium neglectum]
MDGNMFNEAMMSALSGLSYFTPLMCSNTSDSNATKKLLQLRQLGVNTIADPLERRVRINGETPGSDVPQYVCEAFKQRQPRFAA